MDQREDWHLTELLHNSTGRGDPFAAAVRATRMPMVITDPAQPDNPIVFANEAFQKLSGYDRDEIIGRNCRFLQGPESDEGSVALIRKAIDGGNPVAIDLLNYRKDGSTFWNALYLSPVRDDSGTVRFFFASQLDVTDRVEAQAAIARQKALVDREVKRRTAELEAALEAKTLLLHEVDHRVKNNLNMIGSLLRMQVRSIVDQPVKSRLNAMLERVDALATVHRRLYQGDDITRFDLAAFLDTLVADIFGASGRSDVILDIHIEPCLVNSDKASPLGLLLNEVLTNAIKHAYADGRPGTLSVSAHHDGHSGRIEIVDDGPGMDPNDVPRTGLGHTLVTRLARQADAAVEFHRQSPGLKVVVTFPVEA